MGCARSSRPSAAGSWAETVGSSFASRQHCTTDRRCKRLVSTATMCAHQRFYCCNEAGFHAPGFFVWSVFLDARDGNVVSMPVVCRCATRLRRSASRPWVKTQGMRPSTTKDMYRCRDGDLWGGMAGMLNSRCGCILCDTCREVTSLRHSDLEWANRHSNVICGHLGEKEFKEYSRRG